MKSGTTDDPPVDPKRSGIMRTVRAKDTAPERAVRSIVDGLKVRYDLHPGDLPGKPDIAFRKHLKAIFVHGCFWHRHEGCRKSTIPRTRKEWWEAKLAANVARDKRNRDSLSELGWESLTIWECELGEREAVTDRVSAFIGRNPLADLPNGAIPIDRPVPLAECDVPRIDGKVPIQTSVTKEDTAMPRKSAKTGSSRKPITGSTTPVKDPSPKKASTKAAAERTGTTNSEIVSPPALKQERSLPERYSASVDAAKETVTISKGLLSATIRMQSYASVANVLYMLEKSGGVLEAPTSFELKEPFTRRKASISASSLDDVASVINALAISARKVVQEPQAAAPQPADETKPAPKQARPKSSKAVKASAPVPTTPTEAPVEAQPEPSAEVVEATPSAPPDQAPPQTQSPAPTSAKGKSKSKAKGTATAKPVAAKPEQEPEVPAKPAPPPSKPAKGKAKPAAKAAKAAAPVAPDGWLDRDFQPEYSGERFRLVRAEISIDPDHRRNALGRWKEGLGIRAEGYEVLSGDKHIAWVIAEDPKSFILTGVFDLKWTQHRAMIGLLARVGSIVSSRVPA